MGKIRTTQMESLLTQERLQRQQAELLRRIGTQLSTVLDFNELLDLLLDQLALIVPHDSVEILFIIDDFARVVRQRTPPAIDIVRSTIDSPDAPVYRLAETRNLRHIIESGEPLIIPDIQQYDGWVHTDHIPSTFHAWMGIPLFVNVAVCAVLAVYTQKIDHYHEIDVRRLSILARQTELVMENALLYQSTKRQVDELKTLQTLTALASMADDEEKLFTQATAIIEKTFFADNFGILLVNTSGTRLVVHSSFHKGECNTAFSSISVDKGVAGYVFRTGEVVRSGDVSKNQHFVRVDTDSCSELCVPMRANGRILGVINAESAKPNLYTAEDERLLSTVADQLAMAIVKIRLLAQEKQHQRETETLRLAGNALVASLDLNDVLESILVEMEKLVDFDSASALLLEDEMVLIAAGRGFSSELEQNLIGCRFPIGESLAITMVQGGYPVAIDDIRAEPSFHFWGGVTYIRGWLAAPLIVRGEVIGFLTADSRQIGAYGEREQQIIQAFANQAAIAIANAHLYEAERRARETAVILRKTFVKLAESRDLDTMLDRLLTSLAELVDYDSANVMLLKNETLVYKALRGYERWTDVQLLKGIHFNVEDNNAFATIFKRKTSYMIGDTTVAPDWQKTATNGNIRSWLGVPLYAGESIIGCISLDKSEPHFFTKAHMDLVESLSAQTAVIIQNILFLNETEKIGTLLRTLNATPTVVDALVVLTPLIKDIANCQFVSIAIIDDPLNEWYSLYTVADEKETPFVATQRLQLKDSIARYEVLRGNIVYIDDLAVATSYAVEQEQYEAGMRSRVVLPLIAGTKSIGALNLSWAIEHGYDIRKIATFKRIASAIALAVERGDLYDQSRRQKNELETLFSVSTATRLSVTIPDILNVLIQHVEEIIHPFYVGILLPEKSTGDLVAYSHQDVKTSRRKQRIPKGKGICGYVFESGQLYMTTTLADDPLAYKEPEDLPDMLEFGGSVTLPLHAHSRTVGVIHIGLSKGHVLNETEIRLLTSIVEIASSALDRAMALETLEQRVDERTHELTIANQRLTELDRLKSKFVSDVSHELRTPITNLGLYVQLMQRGNAEKQAHYLQVLYLQSERLRNLVEDILSLSRLERLKGEAKLTAVNINEIITQAAQAKRVQSKIGDLTLTITLHPDLPLALSERNQALQAIFNLIDNALNYTHQGGVQIRTTKDDESNMVCITVADTGVGISEQDMPYIFDRFYRGQDIGSSAIPGTGLGLSIVQEVVQLHNGRLSIESEVGKGTIARIWLQKASPETAVWQ